MQHSIGTDYRYLEGLTASETAKRMLALEVFYWGQKGLETTQRVSLKAADIRSVLVEIGQPKEITDYWSEVGLEVYKQGQ